MMLDLNLSSSTTSEPPSPASPLPKVPNHLKLAVHLPELALPKSRTTGAKFHEWIPTPQPADDECYCCCCCCCGCPSRISKRSEFGASSAWSHSIVSVLFFAGSRHNSPADAQASTATQVHEQKLRTSQSPTLKGRVRSPFVGMLASVSRDRPGRLTRQGRNTNAPSEVEASATGTNAVRFSVHA